jgi:arylsulfatase A-like enzyme
MKSVAFLFIAILSWTSLWTSWADAIEPAPPRPNVIMIVSDDHGWTDYGFMKHPHVRTPHLDQLASRSLTFPRGYVTSSLCCPSLATIITGLYPHQHKITSNDPPIPPGMKPAQFHQSPEFALGRERMNEHLSRCETLPKLLKNHGYRSLQTGKWWQGHFSQGGFTDGMTRGGRHGDDGLSIGREGMKPIFDFVDDCVAKQQPYMVWYAPLLPHDPHTPPERILQRYRDRTDSIHVARYWAMIEWFDESIGQLVSGLDERGQLQNTIIIYLADNGWIQSSDNPRYAPKSKQSPYDGGIRTPIMIQWLGTIQPKLCNDLAQSIDLFPTICHALNLPVDNSLPGINLLDESARGSRKHLVGECFTHNFIDLDQPRENLRWRWIVSEHGKLILPNPKVETDAAPELYDLDLDPTEMQNLVDSKPDLVRILTSKLDRWWEP